MEIELTSSGTYTANYLTISGCDSVIELELIVESVDVSTTITTTTISANLSDANYQWIDCDNGNQFIIDEISQTFQPVESGNYAVIINSGICTDTSECVLMNVLELNGHLPTSSINVYPNPAYDKLIIEFNSFQKNIDIRIINTLGEIVLADDFLGTDRLILDVNILISGLYFIEFSIDDQILKRTFVME